MSLMKKAIGGSIHRIREFELEKVNLIDEFDILQIVGEGWFGKILLTEHRSTQTEMVLKALPKAYTGISDFFREFHYGLHLAAHRNIITTYDVAFETAGFYVFSQEYAPLGDLTSNVTETGLGELHAKRVARQLAAAVHHIHSRELVHRDIKLDNILVFRSDFSRIKLCDFGETRRVNSVVRRHNEWLPYSPPEVLQIDTDETYKALTSHDVWQFGIVLFVCLTGCLPWQKAALDDPRYTRYQNWHNATLNIAKKPKLFQLISSRAQRMFKRLLDPKAEKRPISVLEVNKYVEDRWLAKLGAEKAANGGADDRDELCPSMYSFHSSLEEKNQLLHTLTTYGIETTVDRSKKKDRIREWIQASAIIEEYEEEDESDVNEDVHFYEEEEEEPATMKGRHFPETRPIAKPTNGIRKKSRADSASAARKRQPIRPIERKIPFAPQVAEERETIARFASFPNGDPSLATLRNGSDTLRAGKNHVPVPRAGSAPEEVKLSTVNGSPVNNPTASQDDPTPTTSAAHPYPGEVKQEGQVTEFHDRTVNKMENGSPRSPQIPSRKHRTQTTVPFTPNPAGPKQGAENRSEPTGRNQPTTTSLTQPDRTVLSASRTEKSSVMTLPTRADSQSAGNLLIARAERSPAATAENRSAGSTVVAPAERPAAPTLQSMSQVENQSGAMLPAARPENQLVNTVPITRNGKPPQPGTMQVPPAVNALTMPVASHLVMQSFNALQGINTVPPASNETVSASSNGSLSNLAQGSRNSPTGTARTATPPRSKRNNPQVGEETITYGKDAYEHYGIAHGVILRGEMVRQGSTGSGGSRSISN